MKVVYAVRCHFHGDAKANADAAWNLALSWLGVDSPVARSGDAGSTDTDAGHSVEWRSARLDDEAVRILVHHLPPKSDSELGWRTNLWVCRAADHLWGIVRSGPENRAGVVTSQWYDARCPKIVKDWVDQLTVARDGRRLSTSALNYGQNDAETFRDLLLSRDRALPVIGISKAQEGDHRSVLLDPNRLAADLAGDAHVVVCARALSWELTNTIGKELAVYNGAIRIWWPGMTPDDDPHRHPLLFADRIAADPGRAHRQILRRVWNAAVDAIAVPDLELRINSRANRRRVEQRIDQLRKKALDSDEILEAFEEQLQQNELLEDRVTELEVENTDLRDELASAQAGADDTDDDDDEFVESVEDAVRIAADEAEAVVYLQRALDSARESHYPNPLQVLRDLRAVNEVASVWARGEMHGGFDEEFAKHPVRYARGISNTAEKQYRADYEIDYAGERVLMGPHLRRGTGSPTTILRIYWYVDETSRQFIVGHVGRKLRDAKLRH